MNDLPKVSSLAEIRAIAAPTFADPAVISVEVKVSIGGTALAVLVTRDGHCYAA